MTTASPTMAVYKYRLNVDLSDGHGALSEVELPKGATLLRVGWQGGAFSLWALICKSVKETEKRKWLAVETGHEFSAKALKDIAWISTLRDKKRPCEHQETVIAMNGALVFHFWISYP